MQHRIRFCAGFVLATALSGSVSAFGQTAQPPVAPPKPLNLTAALQPPADQGGIVRRLSIDEAVASALEHNLGVQIQRIDPQIQDVGVAQARSFWAPTFSTG